MVARLLPVALCPLSVTRVLAAHRGGRVHPPRRHRDLEPLESCRRFADALGGAREANTMNRSFAAASVIIRLPFADAMA